MPDNQDYTAVTEVTGYNVTSEQIQRMYTRYRFASEFCKDKDVLEIACGSGQGLGYLAAAARKVVGGDYDEKLVDIARSHYGDRIEISRMDAHDLKFTGGSFDVVILYEAIYYLTQPEKFIAEAFRILRAGGTLIIGTANREWDGFNPSPHSHKYLSAKELKCLFEKGGFTDIRLMADCPVSDGGIKSRVVTALKKAAVKFDLMPKTMKGKELFKRIFMGRLIPLPSEIKDGMADYTPPHPISGDSSVMSHKVIFCVGQKK